jgi:hypothetical protein
VNGGSCSNTGVEALFHDVDSAVVHLDLDPHFGVATRVLREQGGQANAARDARDVESERAREPLALRRGIDQRGAGRTQRGCHFLQQASAGLGTFTLRVVRWSSVTPSSASKRATA